MISNTDSNVESASNMEWKVDSFGPLTEDVIEIDDLLMFDCLDADGFVDWLKDACQEEDSNQNNRIEDKTISSSMDKGKKH
eukprot:11654942-Ditylum_brightwellii.AAC.1